MSEWKICSSCKSGIGLKTKYFACSVSSCNGKRTGYVFCSVSCWERHLPGARHRDAAAIEKMSPSQMEQPDEPQRRIVRSPAGSSMSGSSSSVGSREVLVIASKLKAYIKDKADMNTSQSVMDVLSDVLRVQCDRAIDNARADGRKTVLDRDFR